MTLVWSCVYALLCFELGFLSLLLLPVISTRVWCRLFSSLQWTWAWLDRLLSVTWYFWVLLGALSLLFYTSLNEMWKFQSKRIEHKESGGFDAMTLEGDKANLFRAQRNVYVAGLTLFLVLVIRRVMALITALGDIRDKYKQTKKDKLRMGERSQ